MRKLLSIALVILFSSLARAQGTTPNIGLTLPNFNAPNWNVPLNNNFSIIDLVFSSGTCGDSTHALNFDASTKRIGCQTLTGGGGGGGTVTHTTGSLTLNNFILGNGGGDIKDAGFSILPLVNGGTGTPTPNLVAGANVTITGTWPNQTINAAGAGSPSFSVITAGTNTSALLMGSGGSLGVTGSGAIGATTLLGGTWAIPGNIGSTTPATGAFTDLSSTTTGTFNNLTVTGVCTGCAGGTTAFGSITSGTSTGTLLVGTGGSLAATGTGTITASNFLGLTAGTSGGVPYFSSSSALSSSAVLTANLPVIGGGAGSAPAVGTRTGNTTQFASWTGATTASRCIDTDASGNLKITTTDCNAGTVTSVGETFTGGLISVGGSPVTTSGTLALTVAGTSGGIPYFSGPTSWASSALLAANAVMIGGGSGATPSTISGDSTTTHALFATAGAPAFRALTLGDLPAGVGLTANPLSQFAATTSAQLAGVISDETGTGAAVFANTPTLVTPILGAATGTSLNLSGLTASLPICTDGSKNLTTAGCLAVFLPGVTDDGTTFSFTGSGGFSSPSFTTSGTGTGLYAVNGSTSGSCTWTTTSTGSVDVHDCPAQFPAYTSTTNCSGVGTSASPSVAGCSAAPAGSFSCATNATGATCTVNTTAVTANSQIFVQEDETLGIKLGVTCNSSTTVIPTSRLLAARVAGVSFTINLGTVTTNPACFSYFIVN